MNDYRPEVDSGVFSHVKLLHIGTVKLWGVGGEGGAM